MVILHGDMILTHPKYPKTDWTGNARAVVADGSDLANRIMEHYPYVRFQFDAQDNLVDVIVLEKPPLPPTPEEKMTAENLERDVFLAQLLENQLLMLNGMNDLVKI